MIFHREALTALRTKAGLNKTEFAALAGVSVPYVSELESGSKRAPSKDAALRFAEVLGVTPAAIFMEPSLEDLVDEVRRAYKRDVAA